ncbi:MAG TPA: type 4a pilus biogenesis protein PilO [Candidatus Brocadiia bacterium]|nr:type 4a pilus biogenesis protein PilO [Candidatus Brocadiales bacterium]
MKLKRREKILIYIGAMVIVSWGLFHYLYTPKLKEAKRLKQEIALVEQSIQTNLEIIQNSKLLEMEIEQLQKELASLRSIMGGGRQIFQVLEQLGREPSKTDIKLVSIMPKAEEIKLGSPGAIGPSQAVYTKLSIDMRLECQFKALGPYLECLETLPMLIAIDKVQIDRKDEIYPNLAVNLVVDTYTLSNLDVLD